MINKVTSVQTKYEFVNIENLVPENHLLRIIDKHFDFSFVREKLEPYYCSNNGRPGYDPIQIIKMLFIGYWFNIKSERQLCADVEVNVAYTMNSDMVSGKVLHSDSTHIKANANKQKFTKEEVSRETKWYVDELDKSVNENRDAHGKKTLKKRTHARSKNY